MNNNPSERSQREFVVTSLTEFVNHISTRFLRGPSSISVTITSESGKVKYFHNPIWLFRGHSNARWELKPGIYRLPDEYINNGAEIVLFDEFKRLARPHLHPLPQNDWEWLVLAQHYGLPTRLLDWTQNSLAALFFALETPNQGEDSAVWCYKHSGPPVKGENSPFAVNEVAVFYPPHVAQRITAQSGSFTVHPPFPLTSLMIGQSPWRGPLIKFTIPNTSRVAIRKELEVSGIHRASLFPDLDGIATYITRTIIPQRDEEKYFQQRQDDSVIKQPTEQNS